VANKKISRKELLKSPDEFLTLSGRAAAFFSAHIREVKIAGIVMAVILAGYLSIYGYMRHTDKKGQEAYNLAYNMLTEDTDSNQQAQVPAPPDKEKLEAADDLFEEVIDEYGMSKAARLALPQVGHIKFTQQEYEEAARYYERFREEISGHPQYKDLTSLALASCFEAKGEFDKAVSTLTPIVEDPANPFRETAMLNLERLYRLDNQPEKARDILETFIQDYKRSPFLPMAKARL
jgi:predicted negative regulator of RcsB-dependent stress response